MDTSIIFPYFAIIVRTYKRANGESKLNLIRMTQTLNSQIYPHWKLFLIGDHYEDEEEFKSIEAGFLPDKIYAENLPQSLRTVLTIQKNNWTCGGILANRAGIQRAIDAGFIYYVHLDDDDQWTPTHLSTLAHAINTHSHIDFIYTAAQHIKQQILPREYKNQQFNLECNNLFPAPGNTVHSTWCVNLNTLGNLFLKVYDQRLYEIYNHKPEKPFPPLDYTLLKALQDQEDLQYLFIPEVTCDHVVERMGDGFKLPFFCVHGFNEQGLDNVSYWIIQYFTKMRYFSNMQPPYENYVTPDNIPDSIRDHCSNNLQQNNIPTLYSFNNQPIIPSIPQCQHIIVLSQIPHHEHLIEFWVQHIKEATRKTSIFGFITTIILPRFYTDIVYRKNIATRLGLPLPTRHLPVYGNLLLSPSITPIDKNIQNMWKLALKQADQYAKPKKLKSKQKPKSKSKPKSKLNPKLDTKLKIKIKRK